MAAGKVIFCPGLVHNPVNWGEYIAVGRLPYLLRKATPAHADVIRNLTDEASHWLRGKNTDQWARPWPSPSGRDKRIIEDLVAGRTWIVWDNDLGVGTITIDTRVPVDAAQNRVWPAHRLTESALYVHRVIVRRSYAGRQLGAGLLDWASAVAVSTVGSPLLRIEVWTDNWALHSYYRRQGFTLCEYRDPKELPGYPARALFERRARRRSATLFHEPHPAGLTSC